MNEEEIARLLNDKFGLPTEMTRAYLHLVIEGEMPLEQLANRLGATVPHTKELLQTMLERGLIIRASSKQESFQALHPRMMLTNIFKAYEKDIVASLRDRRATVDRVVGMLTPAYEKSEENRA